MGKTLVSFLHGYHASCGSRSPCPRTGPRCRSGGAGVRTRDRPDRGLPADDPHLLRRDRRGPHGRFPGGLRHPLDRTLITAFTELVTANGRAPVADPGSGPGYVTALLHDHDVPAFGVDLSPTMVALAREAHPRLRFHIGSMTSPDLPDGTLGGILALCSIIHVPHAHLPTASAEFHRTLLPGGHVLLAFQSGTDPGHLPLTERFGHEITLDYYWRTPEQVTALLSPDPPA